MRLSIVLAAFISVAALCGCSRSCPEGRMVCAGTWEGQGITVATDAAHGAVIARGSEVTRGRYVILNRCAIEVTGAQGGQPLRVLGLFENDKRVLRLSTGESLQAVCAPVCCEP
jgi:hypothetical protein